MGNATLCSVRLGFSLRKSVTRSPPVRWLSVTVFAQYSTVSQIRWACPLV